MRISEFLLTKQEYQDSCAEPEKTHFINFKLFASKSNKVYNMKITDINKTSYKSEKQAKQWWNEFLRRF